MLTPAVALARGQDALEEPMNVVVLVSDDQRWDSLGAAGNDVIRTPRLDKLAEQGVHFTDAFVTTSICMSSRASILTGQLTSRHGITRFNRKIEPDAFSETYPAVLRQAGYWTGFVGKYGVGDVRQEDFDFARSYERQHWMQDSDGQRIHVTERNARDSIEFLRERPKNQPFLLSVSYFAPHAQDGHPRQYLPQDWSAEFYEGVRIRPTPKGEEHFRALPEFLQQKNNVARIRYYWRFDTPERYQDYMTRYYRLITEMDEAVGRLVDELKSQGVYENTLIVFIGDNGYFQGDRLLAGKWYPYEESIRVPMIVHDPRLPADRRGVKVDEITLNIDIAPTVIKAVGLSVPESVQGKDLSPLYLADRTPEWRDEFLYEHPTMASKERIPGSRALVRKDMKYVRWPDWDYEQLFDLQADPTEKYNLVDDPNYADVLETMQQRMQTLCEEQK
ncbi:MAG: DUF4976 domain-containing protein [Planctomycetaceae bacterium]|nr:MAG: DUF4976 domain-containing protein [Planctomycetaceae bacterium]